MQIYNSMDSFKIMLLQLLLCYLFWTKILASIVMLSFARTIDYISCHLVCYNRLKRHLFILI